MNAPVDTDWRITVAVLAQRFFNLIQTRDVAELAGAPFAEGTVSPWNVGHFHRFLERSGVQNVAVREVGRILNAMAQVGLLLPNGWDSTTPAFGQTYISNRGESSQATGLLWLSEVLHGEIIIPCYLKVTVQITGYAASEHADEQSGTGLVLDPSHVLTNRHVVERMERGIQVHAPGPASGDFGTRRNRLHLHRDIDVAIIETILEEGDPGYYTLGGMTFRNPSWADETYVFGFPRVPMAAESAVTVQRGEVVNPSTPSMPSRDPMFLYSAIARPGNSGGPVVAGDGRVIGLVVEDSAATTQAGAPGSDPPPPESAPEQIADLSARVFELEEKARAPAFYRGIPTSEIVRAVNELDVRDDLIRIETWH
jgi:hypothetical protein